MIKLRRIKIIKKEHFKHVQYAVLIEMFISFTI